MLKNLKYNKKNSIKILSAFLEKRKSIQKNQTSAVKRIIKNVKKNGDKAVLSYEKKFSKIKTKSNKFLFSKEEVNKISKKIDKKLKKAIDLAYSRIIKFHLKQKFSSFSFNDKYKNNMTYKYSSIEKVGVYVPGGTASYPSTVLMNCIPAIVAGVKNIYLATPSLDSKINPAIVYAAKKCGVKKIYKTGGAHTIAALAYGTKKFEKVDKIVGPGNTFVACAKKEVFGDVGIDMVAGPSEVSIVADKSANPDFVAADVVANNSSMFVYIDVPSTASFAVPEPLVPLSTLLSVVTDLLRWYYRHGRKLKLQRWLRVPMRQRLAETHDDCLRELRLIEARLRELDRQYVQRLRRD